MNDYAIVIDVDWASDDMIAEVAGKNCFIGGPSVIYPGVTIGDRVTILPMSVVTRDVKDDEIVSGAPIGKLKGLERKIETLEKMIKEE